MRLVGFDTETFLFGPGVMAPRIVSASFAVENVAEGLYLREDAWEHVARFLANPDTTIVGANPAYDFACVLAGGPAFLRDLVWDAYAAGRISDVLIREKLLDIAGDGRKDHTSYSLAALARGYLGQKLDKGADGWRLRYGELDGVPISAWPERPRAYAVDDAAVLLPIWRAQADRAERLRYPMPTEAEEVRADLALKLSTCWGIHTDGERVAALEAATVRRMSELSSTLIAHGIVKERKAQLVLGGGDDGGEIKKDMAKIYAMVKATWPADLGEIPRTKTGKVVTDADTLEMCSHPALEAMIEWSSLQKQGSTYIRRLKDGTGSTPLHPSYDAVVSSDRTSSFDPNIQNQPRLPGVRECFVPRPGHVFVSCDFDAQEMRSLAQACLDLVGRSRLAERFNASADFDPHTEFTAEALLRIPIADAVARLAVVDKEAKDARQAAKIVNFGLPGGLGVDGLIRFSKGYGRTIDRKTAEAWIKAYKGHWTEMPKFFSAVGAIVGPTGRGTVRIHESGFVRGNCGYTDGCNTQFQTRAAHASKAALFEAARRCHSVRTSWLYGARIVAFIHDEILLEVREEWAHEAAIELREIMEAAEAKWLPGVRPSASPTSMRRWSKAAEENRDRGGRLIPWDEQRSA